MRNRLRLSPRRSETQFREARDSLARIRLHKDASLRKFVRATPIDHRLSGSGCDAA